MKFRLAVAALLGFTFLLSGSAQSYAQSAAAPGIPYGDNKDAGAYVVLDGARLYYETYGQGEPLLLLHGNGGNIAGMRHQIEYFAEPFKGEGFRK